MREILVLCPFGVDRGLISKAVQLAGDAPVRVLVPETEREQAYDAGASVIHALSAGQIGDEFLFSLWLAEKITQWGSKIILAPATVAMRNIMPMLAWHLKGGLTADCTGLELDGEELIQIRPAFGNSLMATIRATSPVQMATVRPGTFPPRKCPARSVTVIPETYRPGQERVLVTEERLYEEGRPLSQAEIVVAGGRGIGSREGFRKLEALAAALNAGLGASRAAVDAGFAPYRCQIGMTGATVCPKVYIAVGISGAVQHLAGMSGAETVIAVNSDPKAPIFDYADLGIVGDWEEVIDLWIAKLKEDAL